MASRRTLALQNLEEECYTCGGVGSQAFVGEQRDSLRINWNTSHLNYVLGPEPSSLARYTALNQFLAFFGRSVEVEAHMVPIPLGRKTTLL